MTILCCLSPTCGLTDPGTRVVRIRLPPGTGCDRLARSNCAWGSEASRAGLGRRDTARISRARREVSKPAIDSARMSDNGCSEVGHGASAIFSENVNCVQNFANTKLVEEI